MEYTSRRLRKGFSRNDSTKAVPLDKTKHNKQMLRTRKRAADLKRYVGYETAGSSDTVVSIQIQG